MNIIEVKNLSYSYDHEHDALKNVNINIPKGCITAVLGGNGAGKSTLFLNLNGVLKPQQGEVYFQGKRMEYSNKNLIALKKKVGIVFQDPNDQLFSADVLSDIAFGPLNLGMPEQEVKRELEKVITQTGIGEYLHKPTHALSFGQKKRVAIAGVLAMKPEVIILDEPTAGLDPFGVSDILKLLLKLKTETDLTIMISTHDIDIVPLYCDWVYVLDHGEVVLSGAAADIFAKAEELRQHALRLPRIAHLMEVLNKEDGLDVDVTAATISKARKSILELMHHENTKQ